MNLETESITSGVKDPRIVVWTLHAGVETVGGAGQLSGAQWTRVGQRTEWLTLDITLLLPV